MPKATIGPLPPRGGPEPVAQELVLSGPFRGFDSDESQWFLGKGGILDDCSNVDFLKGQIQTRPGLNEVVADISTVTPSAGAHYPQEFAPVGIGTSFPRTSAVSAANSQIFAYSKLWAYQSSFASLPTSVPTGWLRSQVVVKAGSASTVAAITTVTGSLTTWLAQPLSGAYFKINTDGDSAWTQIAGVTNNTSLELVAGGYLGSTSGGFVAYTIVVPMVQDNNIPGEFATDFVPVPFTSNVAVTGGFGSRLMVAGSNPVYLQKTGTTPDLPVYQANSCAVYNNRMFLATDRSASDNTVLFTTNHGGKVVWSKNGDFTIYNTTTSATAGATDLECGSVRWLLVLRDTLYAFSQDGIFSIQKTGNSRLPFRTQQVVRSARIPTTYKPVAVDGAFAYMIGMEDVYRFDGSSLPPVAPGVQEYIKGFINNSTFSGFPSAMGYDRFLRRIVITNPLLSTPQMLLFDVDRKIWSKYTASGANIRAVHPWYSTSAGGQNEELVLFGTNKLMSLRRASVTDAIPSAGSAITWSATSPILDAPSSRDIKSCSRIRVSYEVGGTSTNNITVTLFKDGGTTAVFTGTLNVGGATPGVVTNGYLTFPAISGQQWSVSVSGVSVKKVKINQIALYFVGRQEAKPT